MPGDLATAAGLFVATNVDDLVLLTLWFGRAGRRRSAVLAVVAGQYLGLAAIVAVAVAGAAGASLLPEQALPWLGLVPIALGVRAGVGALRDRRRPAGSGGGPDGDGHGGDGAPPAGVAAAPPTVWAVAAVTLASGGDNVGVYVPVLAADDRGSPWVFAAAFVVLVALWCGLAAALARHPVLARAIDRWGDVALPVVLVALGVWIIVAGLAGVG